MVAFLLRTPAAPLTQVAQAGSCARSGSGQRYSPRPQEVQSDSVQAPVRLHHANSPRHLPRDASAGGGWADRTAGTERPSVDSHSNMLVAAAAEVAEAAMRAVVAHAVHCHWRVSMAAAIIMQPAHTHTSST